MIASRVPIAVAVLISSASVALAATPLETTVRYVDCAAGDDTNGGLTPETALRTVQSAIDAAPMGVAPEVRIAPGSCIPPAPDEIVRVQLGSIGAIVRGAGADLTELVGHQLIANPEGQDGREVSFVVEGLTLEGVSAFQHVPDGGIPVLELRDCRLRFVGVSGARALLERNIIQRGVAFERARGNGEMILRDSLFSGDLLAWGVVAADVACPVCDPHGHSGPVRIENNVFVALAQPISLLAEDGGRMTAIVRGNVFIGAFDPIFTRGSVVVAGGP